MSVRILIYFLLISAIVTLKAVLPDEATKSVIPDSKFLLENLDTQTDQQQVIRDLYLNGKEKHAVEELVDLLKEKAGKRYYFDWQNFDQRFQTYNMLYISEAADHAERADYHISRFAAETSWELPFDNLLGEEVSAYEFRHLARQSRAPDIAMMYHYQYENTAYLDYWLRQVNDLNRAVKEDRYDKGGNAVFEAYRAGRRVQHWLFCHNAYLYSDKYAREDQLLLIRTFLYHGSQLQEKTRKNKYGNHHTRGLVALFEISVLFSDFKITAKWRDQAIAGLVWHLENEVNTDGFQFERSVHYHKSDIENYFRVYQLAQINHIDLPASYLNQFKKMFESLVKLAQPNRRLPVFQDDTEEAFAENNIMHDAMTAGTLLFRDPVFRYFAINKLAIDYYWLLPDDQLEILSEIEGIKPTIGSTELTESGYFVMRNGWENEDCYMTVTAGLSIFKPDHQHGDMLGVVAYANGHEILPNYQIKYRFPDYPFWKNSFAKNVAIVDNIPQGREFEANEGNSGFGKWLRLPVPETLVWITRDKFDYFAGTHDGYANEGVIYFREILFIKDGFWLIRDHFKSEQPHTYQQVWQGDFSVAPSARLATRLWEDGSGLQIIQLANEQFMTRLDRKRDKSSLIFELEKRENHIYHTLVSPFRSDPLEISADTAAIVLTNNWTAKYKSSIEENDFHSNAAVSVSRNGEIWFLFDLTGLKVGNETLDFPEGVSMLIEKAPNGYKILILGFRQISVQNDLFGGVKQAGDTIFIKN